MLKNYYHYDGSLDLGNFKYSLEENCGIFPNKDANGKYGMLDINQLIS